MATVNLDFTLTFQLDVVPKKLELVDTTDYTGFNFTGVTSTWEIKSPDGSVLSSGVQAAAAIPTQLVSLPLLSDGSVEPGIYTATISNDSDPSNTTTTAFNFCYESPAVTISLQSDCIKSELISSDTTAYISEGITPSIVRDHKIYFPSSLNLAPVSTTGSSFVLTSFFTETQTAQITSTLVYDFGSGVFIEDEVEGSQEHKVVCDATLCDLYCSFIILYNRYKDAKGTNEVIALQEEEKFIKAMSIRSLIKDSLECNKGDNVNELVSDVLKLTGTQPGCGCEDGEPVPVVGLATALGGSSSITIVDTTGNGIEVTSNTIGDTTTYTLNLQASLISKLNGLQNSTVIAPASNLVTVTETIGGGGDKTYEITDKPNVLQNRYSTLVEITFDRGLDPVFNILEETFVGTAFQSSTGVSISTFSAPVDFTTKSNRFLLADFLSSAAGFSPSINVLKVTRKNKDPLSLVGLEDMTDNFDFKINDYDTTGNGGLFFSMYESSSTTGVVSKPSGNGLKSGTLTKTKNRLQAIVSIVITK